MTILTRIAVVIAALAGAPAAIAGVVAYPSSQTIPGTGRLPQGSSSSITLNAARGEREGAWIVDSGIKGRMVSASIDGFQLGSLQAALYFGHFVEAGGRTRPDALNLYTVTWWDDAHPPRTRLRSTRPAMRDG